MMDLNNFIKDELGKALEVLPPEQRVDMNRFINRLGNLMGTDEKAQDMTREERLKATEKNIKEVLEIDKEMQAKYGVNSNR